MLTYDRLAKTAKAFPALTGLTRDEFDRLFGAFEEAADALRATSTHTKRGSRKRKRAAGAGRRHSLASRTRLLMALVWLRVYPTYEILGWLFGLEKSNAWENVQDVLAVLETLADFPFERPAPRRRSREQRGGDRRVPGGQGHHRWQGAGVPAAPGWDEQKPFYSGKKKRHTVKNQIICTPEGGSSRSRHGPGLDPRPDDAAVRRDPRPAAERETAMADKAYTGAATDPGMPLVLPTKATRGHPLTDEQKAANKVISGNRVVIEHVMAQLNRFQVLKQSSAACSGVTPRRSGEWPFWWTGGPRCPLKTYPVAA